MEVFLLFLSLGYGADLGRSRLVFSTDLTLKGPLFTEATETTKPLHLSSPASGNLVQTLSFMFSFLNVTYKTEQDENVPFSIFSALRLRIFLNVSQWSPFKIIIFCLIFGFLNKYPPKFFFNTVRILEVRKKILRYIRIFNVICELHCVLLRRKRRFENKRSHLSQHAISDFLTFVSEVIFVLLMSRRIKKAFAFVSARYIQTSEAFSEHEKHPYGVSKLFSEFFMKTFWADFKNLRFLSLRFSF